MKIKRILAAAVLSATAMGCMSVMTETEFFESMIVEAYYNGTDLYYKKISGTIMISGCSSSAVSVEIPSEIDGLPVKRIGYEAFCNCSSLESITIPDSVTSIGDHAFYNCSSLESITIPDSVTSIGDLAFSGCTSLSTLIIADGSKTITSEMTKTSEMTNGLKSYIKEVIIPDSVTSIGDNAFRGCSSLTSITIPDSVTTIGNYSFSGCSKLIGITVPDSVTSIGDGAFSSCSSLTSITIPDSSIYLLDNNFFLHRSII